MLTNQEQITDKPICALQRYSMHWWHTEKPSVHPSNQILSFRVEQKSVVYTDLILWAKAWIQERMLAMCGAAYKLRQRTITSGLNTAVNVCMAHQQGVMWRRDRVRPNYSSDSFPGAKEQARGGQKGQKESE